MLEAPEKTEVLAVIPAYNEALQIGQVITDTLCYLPVLVIDDGSADETVTVAETAGATVVRQPQNMGKGAALRRGMTLAFEAGYQAVLTLDADGQHDPAEVPDFLQVYHQQQPALIIGRRQFKSMPPVRRLANQLGGQLFSLVLGQPIPDNQSGYRLISRRLGQTLLVSQEAGFEFEMEMIVRCIQQGEPLAWVPIRTIYGQEKSHIRPVSHTLHFMRLLWQTYWAVRRQPPAST